MISRSPDKRRRGQEAAEITGENKIIIFDTNFPGQDGVKNAERKIMDLIKQVAMTACSFQTQGI